MSGEYHNVPGIWTPEVQVEFEASGVSARDGSGEDERTITGITIEDVAMPAHIVKAISEAVKDSEVLSTALYDADCDIGAETFNPWWEEDQDDAEDRLGKAEYLGEDR